MSKTHIAESLSRAVHSVGFTLKKYSPQILLGAGIVGGVASTVLACKATLKVNDTLEAPKKNIDKIHKATESGHTESGLPYTAEDSKKELAIVYAHTALDIVKLYGPAALLGATSIACILTSNNIMRKRNLALAAAYTAIDTSFKEYRGRVVERFGKQLDRELKYNLKAVEVEETVTDEEGNTTTVKKTVEVADIEQPSEYAMFFCEGCRGWTKNAQENRIFLEQTQNWANDVLRLRGHLFLNEVYDALGINRTKAGNIVGWKYDKKNGDSYVDFGIYNTYGLEPRHAQAKMNFVNGAERSILLDFNVDGPIIDLI